jgi:hypothetical protein
MRYAIITKRPDEKFAVGFQYSSADLANGATISSVTATIEKVDLTETTNVLAIVGTPVKEDFTVSAIIEKGNANKEYYVNFKTTTSAGYVFVDKVFVKVRE